MLGYALSNRLLLEQNTVEALLTDTLLTDTLVSGQFYSPSLIKPRFLTFPQTENSHRQRNL